MAKQPDLDEFLLLFLTGPTDMVWVHNSEETAETTEGHMTNPSDLLE